MKKIIIASITLLLSAWVSAEALYPFNALKQETQFQCLLKNLRCLVCQNQDLVDSNAPLAKDLRQLIYQKVLEGWTDQQIITYLTARYGDFILFNPPLKQNTYILWGFPLFGVCIGLVFFLKRVRQND